MTKFTKIYPKIIAEIGINHNGSLNMAMEMIRRAKENGADIAKFQVYQPEKLLDKNEFSPEDWKAILDSEIHFDDLQILKAACDEHDIEFMASAFDLERLEWLEKLNVKKHKIASRTVFDTEYCKAVLDTGKEVLVSNGGLRGKPREEAQNILRLFYDYPKVKILHCVAEYPTSPEKVIFERNMFRKGFSGWSDHTESILHCIAAITLGAEYIEKHYTLDKNLPGPDQKGSMDNTELRSIANYRNGLYHFNVVIDLEEEC